MAGDTIVHDFEKTKGEKKSRGVFKWIIKQISDFSIWNNLFKALVIIFVLWGGYLASTVIEFRTNPEYSKIRMTRLSEFKLVIPFTLMFFGLKYLFDILFTNFFLNNLSFEKFPTQEERIERAKKSTKWLLSICYYSFSTIACYLICYDQFFFPPMLGGKGNSRDLFKYSPDTPPEMPYTITFYMLQFSCHLYSLTEHVIYKLQDPKFWEMFMHHLVAVFLILFSYLSGEVGAGLLVLFTHDSGDVFLDFSRLLNDFKKEKTGIFVHISWVLFMLDWIFFRLFAFPKYVVTEALWDMFYGKGLIIDTPILPLYGYLIAMLCALVFLHFYWFAFILKIAINIVRGKKEFNTYDNKKAKKTG
jgi:TLC domain